jgi:hypothetical protein
MTEFAGINGTKVCSFPGSFAGGNSRERRNPAVQSGGPKDWIRSFARETQYAITPLPVKTGADGEFRVSVPRK